MAKDNKSRKSGKNTGIALAVWIVLAIALFILFIIKWDDIVGNLKETGFFGKVFGKTPTYVEEFEAKEKVSESENDVAPLPPNGGGVIIDLNGKANVPSSDSTSPAPLNDSGKKDNESSSEAAVASGTSGDSKNSDNKDNASVASASENKNNSESKNDKPASAKTETSKSDAPKTMNIKLYFMSVKADGSVVRKEVVRTMKKSDSPLVDSINALIAGPVASERDVGCRTLVSSGTRILGASIRNGVATLNFSSAFEQNEVGIEGLRGQLEQIVYTATAFPTVDSVQFLIEGEKKQFLGEEGVWIGTPLNRNSF